MSSEYYTFTSFSCLTLRNKKQFSSEEIECVEVKGTFFNLQKKDFYYEVEIPRYQAVYAAKEKDYVLFDFKYLGKHLAQIIDYNSTYEDFIVDDKLPLHDLIASSCQEEIIFDSLKCKDIYQNLLAYESLFFNDSNFPPGYQYYYERLKEIFALGSKDGIVRIKKIL